MASFLVSPSSSPCSTGTTARPRARAIASKASLSTSESITPMTIAFPGASRPFSVRAALTSTSFPIGPPPVCSTVTSLGASLLASTITFDLSIRRPLVGRSSFNPSKSRSASSLSL